MKIQVCSFKDTPEFLPINTTSRSTNWSRGLSPFVIPCVLSNGMTAKNVENAWQFSKVYKDQLSICSDIPSVEWYEWRKAGFEDSFAHRYPKGKGAIPLYTFYDGEQLSYIEARKKLYIPAYANNVRKTEAYKQLYELVIAGNDISLIDFDGYDYAKLNMSFDDVINCESRKMGHAFVLAMLLEGYLK